MCICIIINCRFSCFYFFVFHNSPSFILWYSQNIK
nr:MAG TPA: hypothetical protein [Bacteriophage sp.]